MFFSVSQSSDRTGQLAADFSAGVIAKAVEERGAARIVLSTGQSQFEFLDYLVKEDIPWDKVEMFHLDEYIGLDLADRASFCSYLNERFISRVSLKKAYLIGKMPQEELKEAVLESPIDLGVVGIGENGHIAFNDPPCNVETKEPYITVRLDERCRRQQVREGWFDSLDSVPSSALTMSCYQVLQCRTIVSVVPHDVKAEAVMKTLYAPSATRMIPATLLKCHPDWHLYLDEDSFAGVDRSKIVWSCPLPQSLA